MNKYITIIALAILTISCGSDEKKTTSENNSSAVSIKISSINADNNNPFFTVSGKIEAVESVTLSTRTSGYVDNIYVKVGDKVRKGDLLISINNADLKAKRAQVNAGIIETKAAYNNAEKDYNRYKNLFDKNSASQKELDDMTANFEMAKARLEAANEMMNEINAQFKYVDIKAPFSGVVTTKFIETGDLANPGVPLISVESPEKFEVTIMVAESEISQVKKETTVEVLVKSINKTLTGVVSEVSTSANNTGGQYLVKITLNKTDAAILSGMYTNVKFPSNKKIATNKVLIPLNVIVKNGQLRGVYTVSQNNTAILRWLRLGKTFGNEIEVLSGLNADEQYIVSAEGKLYNGVKVAIK
ncbi:MAG: efflux RND transporter periplasmic adaptor subunit [Flavobacteriaceae bacterium]